MFRIGQRVDRGDARELGEVFDILLGEGANHRAVDHASEDAGCVLNGFAATELDVSAIKEKNLGSQFSETHFKAHTGPGGTLAEDERPGLAGQRSVMLTPAALERGNTVQDIPHFSAGQCLEAQQVFHRTRRFRVAPKDRNERKGDCLHHRGASGHVIIWRR